MPPSVNAAKTNNTAVKKVGNLLPRKAFQEADKNGKSVYTNKKVDECNFACKIFKFFDKMAIQTCNGGNCQPYTKK